jgi:hypothetical protein
VTKKDEYRNMSWILVGHWAWVFNFWVWVVGESVGNVEKASLE